MADNHQPTIPTALEHVTEALSELETVLGEAARRVIPAVQARLTEALAARERGDPFAALRAIAAAMEGLTSLADRLDPQEGATMRRVAERFQTALLRGDMPEAKQDLDVMFERSGALERREKQPKFQS